MEGGIYLVVRFNFPSPFQPEYGEKAKALHQALQGQDWIQEVFAGSGGIGGGPSAIWVMKLDNFAALDRLFGGEDVVSKAYVEFFGLMDDVDDLIREAVVFS